jgi:hypothetical protein
MLEKIATGSAPMVVGSGEHRHSFAYTPDAGRATALLGCTEDAFGQIWHAPCADPAPTQAQLVAWAARIKNGPAAKSCALPALAMPAQAVACVSCH